MHSVAHRAGRAAIVSVVAGAATLGLAASAFAAGAPARSEEHCSDPVDGATVCYVFTRGEEPTDSTVTATVRIEEGRALEGALVVIEACESDCKPVGVATGQNTREVSVTKPYGRGVGYYRANASWVDDQQHFHTGVTSPA